MQPTDDMNKSAQTKAAVAGSAWGFDPAPETPQAPEEDPG